MTRSARLTLTALPLLVAASSGPMAQTQVTRPASRSIWDGVYTDAQARRGEELYAKHCSRCHGADLAGLPWEALGQAMPEALRSYLHFDRSPELTGPTFYSNYDRLLLSDLVERIRISMPTDKPGIPSRKDTVDVVGYLLFFGGFPLGRTELSERLEDQRDIGIVAYRP
jgi:S-disulfanyl-L-cysteine oxidoreductase SoxD